MPRLKVLSGREVLDIFYKFNFAVIAQKGSHVKIARQLESGKQTLTIPLHKELDKGTLRAIFRQACHFIPEDNLSKHFYTEE